MSFGHQLQMFIQTGWRSNPMLWCLNIGVGIGFDKVRIEATRFRFR